jgi:hypothetical protein
MHAADRMLIFDRDMVPAPFSVRLSKTCDRFNRIHGGTPGEPTPTDKGQQCPGRRRLRRRNEPKLQRGLRLDFDRDKLYHIIK